MTSTVGGLWDSLLAEGKAWWITANSDSHDLVHTPPPHVAVTLALPYAPDLGALPAGAGVALGDVRAGPAELAASAARAVEAHAGRTGGRAVVYPGVTGLIGTLSAATVLATCNCDAAHRGSVADNR